MNITKTEVSAAILATEAVSHGDVLSYTPVTITQGQLAVLLEAAKCTKYRQTIGHRDGASGATTILDDGSPVITGIHRG